MNTTQTAHINHFKTHEEGMALIAIMNEIDNLKQSLRRESEVSKQEILSLKQEVQALKTQNTHIARPSTPPPGPQPLPPAPASPPSFPGTSTSCPYQPSAPTYAQRVLGRNQEQVLEQDTGLPPAFLPASRPQGKAHHFLLADSVTQALVYTRLEAPTGSMIRSTHTQASTTRGP